MPDSDQLQQVLNSALESTSAPVSSRVDTLSKLIGIFKTDDQRYSDKQLGLFDEVFNTLLVGIEEAFLEVLSEHIAETKQTPPELLKRFALNEAAPVAGPVLQNHYNVPEPILIEVALTRGEEHLLYLSKRDGLPASVTRPLVIRGSEGILANLIENYNADFSIESFEILVERSAKVDDLAQKLAYREDLPHSLASRLIRLASQAVKDKFKDKFPAAAATMDMAVDVVSAGIERKVQAQHYDFQSARRRVEDVKFGVQLSPRDFTSLIKAKDLEGVMVAFSDKTNLTVEIIVELIHSPEHLYSLALARVSGLTADIVRSWMRLRASLLQIETNLDQVVAVFEKLDPKLALSIIDAKRYVNTIKKS